mmetsp:Transcript_10211/g.18326  ORF Transcript_10211/g.18326 Transcript_10211/m.18326 type:complete len:109 (-) Transcript_10211:346-672(-)
MVKLEGTGKAFVVVVVVVVVVPFVVVFVVVLFVVLFVVPFVVVVLLVVLLVALCVVFPPPPVVVPLAPTRTISRSRPILSPSERLVSCSTVPSRVDDIVKASTGDGSW